MKKSQLLRYVGSMQQVCYARRIIYDEGRARGLSAVEVVNGPLRFVVMLDKCLDVSELSWRGEQISFMGKTGLNGRNQFDTHGLEAQRSIMGGLFFTCGFENICAPYTDKNGKEYPMHGRMRTSPAEHISVKAGFDDDDIYRIEISGDIREAELFGENILLHRTISTVYGEPQIYVRDEIFNEAFRDEPIMLMYHCNFGYPFVTEKSRILLPTKKVVPRDKVSEENAQRYSEMDSPFDNAEEYVYLHEMASDENGKSYAAIVDDNRELGVLISYDSNELQEFGEWKSTGSGDYVIGLEPSNSKIYGRKYAEDTGSIQILKPQQKKVSQICFSVLEGCKQISEIEKNIILLKGKN